MKGKPIFNISRVLKGAERNYTVTKKEMLATMWGMEKLAFYLHGNHFILKTDHKPLEAL